MIAYSRKLTKRQACALVFMVRYRQAKGVMPLQREVGEFLGAGQGSMITILNKLDGQGFIEHQPGNGIRRNVTITPKGLEYARVILSRIEEKRHGSHTNP